MATSPLVAGEPAVLAYAGLPEISAAAAAPPAAAAAEPRRMVRREKWVGIRSDSVMGAPLEGMLVKKFY